MVNKILRVAVWVFAVVGLFACAGLLLAQQVPYLYNLFIADNCKVEFRDPYIYINSSVDGQLDIDADTEVEITTTTVDLNGILNVSGRVYQGSGFWADCPVPSSDPSVSFQYFEDFIGTPFVASTNAFEGWKTTADASYVVASAAGTLGGIVSVTPVTGSNNEVYLQLGELGTETFLEYTASSGLKSWVEFRFTTDAITDAGNIFLGLAEEGSSAAEFFNDSGADIADKDVIGFVVWEGNPDTLEYIFQTSGGAFSDTPCALLVAGTYVTAGIYFDGATSVIFYINGVAVATVPTTTALFPDEEELSPIIALKNGAADKSVFIDWIKFVSER